jgi:hypothetical protein
MDPTDTSEQPLGPDAAGMRATAPRFPTPAGDA